MDVSALYTNIPQDEGLTICKKALNTRQDQKVPTDFIITLLALSLRYNIFSFGKDLYQQLIGTAMGIHPAPSYANLFMAEIDESILNLCGNRYNNNIKFFKRFLDDIAGLWTGSLGDLYEFFREVNQIHPNIKFTLNHSSPYECNMKEIHDCWCYQTKSVPFLDTLMWIENGKIHTDLYRKPTDRCQYLLPSSCHPAHITENIPYSLAYRIVRICSTVELRDKRLDELQTFLQEREYSQSTIIAAITRAKQIDREHALRRVIQNNNQNRVIFA